MSETASPHVVVLGLMGAGKSSIGRRVATALGRPLIDGDERLEARTGRTAAQIAEADGIEALHALESVILLEALAAPDAAVVAPAASTAEDHRCLVALAATTLVWLTAPAAHLARDVADKVHRPLVGDGDAEAVLARQQAVREPLIAPIADLVIDVASTSKDAAAARIVALVKGAAG